MLEPLLMVTFDVPAEGATINVDGERYVVRKIVRFTGTVARLLIEPLAARSSATPSAS